MKADFTRNLLRWNKTQNKRAMPWKGEKNPYRIWLSEIILQQTRVEQGIDYYHKFIKAFPNVHLLAGSPSKKLFKLWEGLGYNNRCRNLHETAKYISSALNGSFPTTYPDILRLKGIGQYTASAIASFAYNLPHAVVDANVERVISRYFGIRIPAGSSAAKKIYLQLADALLDKKNPGVYNQAIMDFGALICKPRAPLCTSCIQRKECVAFRNGWVDQLPQKALKPEKKTRWFYFYLLQNRKEEIYISKREKKDIWENLYEFPQIESSVELNKKQILRNISLLPVKTGKDYIVEKISDPYTQQLSHQIIQCRFIHIHLKRALNKTTLKAVNLNKLNAWPFPRIISLYLQNTRDA